MKYFAVFLPMLSPEKSKEYRSQHFDFLAAKRKEGKIFANGRFLDGSTTEGCFHRTGKRKPSWRQRYIGYGFICKGIKELPK